MVNIVLEKFSHITYKKRSENSFIKRIPKGTEYISYDGGIEEDAKYKWWVRMYLCGYKYIAKEDRWYSGDGEYCKTVGDVEKDWNKTVIYDKKADKWYNRPALEICLLNGEKRKMWFDTDEELSEELDHLTKNMKHNIILYCED